jgi:large subunit ribosomal protein L18
MKLQRKQKLKRRHMRIRNKLSGTTARPRLFIRKSLKHFHAQVIDDSIETGSVTLATYTTASKDTRGKHCRNVASAEKFGKEVGEALLQKNIDTIVFDRGGYSYHGCVKAIAEAVRSAGVRF